MAVAEPIVYRAGAGAASGVVDADPITTEVDPPRPELGRRADEARADPHVVLAGHLRGARLRGRALRPRHPPARAGAEPAALHGHDELLRRGRGRGGRRRGGARAGRHHPLQRPLRHRLAPAGRRRGDAGLPARRASSSATRRSRRTGSTSAARSRTPPTRSTSSRRARSSPASSSTAAASWSRTSSAWRSRTRGCRRWSPATSTPRSSACAPAPPGSLRLVERYGLETLRRVRSSACSTTARPWCAATSSSCPDGRYVGHGEMDANGVTDDPVPFEVDGRDRRLDACASTSRTRPTQQAGADQLPARRRPSRPAGSRSRCSPAAARRPNEGHFRPIEVVTRPGSMFHPLPPVAVLPLRLAGDAGDRGRSTRRSSQAMPDGRARLQRRRHLRARLVGRPRADRRAVGRRRRRTRSARARRCTATARAA